MATYRAIAASETASKGPVTTQLFDALKDNPTAISEGAIDAPVNQTGWHPYDMVTISDGADGLFWDFAVDGTGTDLTVDSPTFTNKFEYALFIQGLSGAASGTVDIQLNLTVTGYVTADTASITPAQTYTGVVAANFPRSVLRAHTVTWLSELTDATGASVASGSASALNGTAQKAANFRLNMSAGNYVDAGKLYLWRRRVFTVA
jgi:hypothetical protein